MEKRKAGRPGWVILGLCLLFVVPIVASWIMVVQGWRPTATSNHGHLLQPPLAVAEAGLLDVSDSFAVEGAFSGHWSVLVAQPGACGEACKTTLDALGRVHVALNKDMDRVRIALLQPSSGQALDLPDQLPVLQTAESTFQRLATARGKIAADGPTVHIVDPRGWLIMAYPYPLDASGLLDDLERLLRASDEKIERRARPREDV